MTINQARQIVNFVVECKMKKMLDEDIIWELANKFNIDAGPKFNVNSGPTETAMKIKTNKEEM